MNRKINKYCILTLLVLVFAAPGIIAYMFYSHPWWIGSSRTNKGVLLKHPIKLTSIEKKEKWHIILWAPKHCNEACLGQLDILARVRLALGRKLYQVDQMLMLGEESLSLSAPIEELLKTKDFKINILSEADTQRIKQISKRSQIFIMNPDNYLVLIYKSNANPDYVYKDLKLLINTSELN